MRTSFSENIPCPCCGVLSNSVSQYLTRTLKHYALNGMESKIYQGFRLRCKNEDCSTKSFTYYPAQIGLEDFQKGSRYTKSSKFFVSNKMLKHQVSYNSLQTQLKEDFGGNTAISTLYTWTKQVKIIDNEQDITNIVVLHTDEKHPLKKKSKQL